MELAHIRVGFPVLLFETRIHHATPRAPTAFERALLGICNRFGADSAFNSIPLERIFADILAVADPARLLSCTIHELVNLNVLRCQGDADAVGMLMLRDLEITERGRQMLSEDLLPAQPQQADEVFAYDPVRKRFLTAVEVKTCRIETPALALDAGVFEEVFPEDAMRASVLSGGYSWWNASSRIERIERVSSGLQWREFQATVGIDQKVLRFSFKDAERTDYVASLDAESIQQRLLGPSFNPAGISVAQLAAFRLSELDEDIGADAKWTPISTIVRDFPGRARFWLLDLGGPFAARPNEVNSNQAIVCFDASRELGSVEVTWNEAHDGAFVDVGGPFPLDDALIASNEGLVRGRRVRVKVGREILELPLALHQGISTDNLEIAESLGRIEDALRQSEEEDSELVAALWQSQEQFWRERVGHIGTLATSVAGGLRALLRLRKLYTAIGGPIPSEVWDNLVADYLCCALSAEIGRDDAEDLVGVISQCNITSPDAIERSMLAVTAWLPLPKSVGDFGHISTAIAEACPDWRLPFPSRLYTPEVLAAAVREFPSDSLLTCFFHDNDFDVGLRGLLQTLTALDGLIGGNGVRGLAIEEDFLALLKSPRVNRISEQAALWSEHHGALTKVYPETMSYFSDAPLTELNARIQRISALTRQLVVGLNPEYRAVYVLDTSALLFRPEILNSFWKDELVVVSKRVIEELDDKKLDESLRPKVTEATRALQSFPRNQIQFCDGDMSLLAPDYRLKGDNLILSVAVRYRRQRPVLITNDRNLTLKATAEDIEAMSVEEFEQRPNKAGERKPALREFSEERRKPSRPSRPRR